MATPTRVLSFLDWCINKGVLNAKFRNDTKLHGYMVVLFNNLDTSLRLHKENPTRPTFYTFYMEWCEKCDPLRKYKSEDQLIRAKLKGVITEEDYDFRLNYITHYIHNY